MYGFQWFRRTKTGDPSVASVYTVPFQKKPSFVRISVFQRDIDRYHDHMDSCRASREKRTNRARTTLTYTLFPGGLILSSLLV